MKFDYYLDTKQTVWRRTYFSVEAETFGEATDKMLRIIEDDDIYNDDHFVENEILYDTFEDMSVEENGGWATKELFSSEDEMIWENNNNENDN